MELLVSNFLQYKAIRKKADLGKKCFSEGRFLQVLYAFSHVKTELPHWTRNFYGKPLSLKKQCPARQNNNTVRCFLCIKISEKQRFYINCSCKVYTLSHTLKQSYCTEPQIREQMSGLNSQDFIIWRINSELWTVVWAGMWNKRVWANMSNFCS